MRTNSYKVALTQTPEPKQQMVCIQQVESFSLFPVLQRQLGFNILMSFFWELAFSSTTHPNLRKELLQGALRRKKKSPRCQDCLNKSPFEEQFSHSCSHLTRHSVTSPVKTQQVSKSEGATD